MISSVIPAEMATKSQVLFSFFVTGKKSLKSSGMLWAALARLFGLYLIIKIEYTLYKK